MKQDIVISTKNGKNLWSAQSHENEMSWCTTDVAPLTMGCYFNDEYSVVWKSAGHRMAADFF